MLTKLAIWYLRKRKRSVMIGFSVQPYFIQPHNRDTFLYDNRLTDIKFIDYNGDRFVLPEGRFHIQMGGKQ